MWEYEAGVGGSMGLWGVGVGQCCCGVVSCVRVGMKVLIGGDCMVWGLGGGGVVRCEKSKLAGVIRCGEEEVVRVECVVGMVRWGW